MARFKVGDRVERVGTHVPEHMKTGRIVRVIPHPQLSEDFTEYEVDFGNRVASFYQTQLRLVLIVKDAKLSKAP